MRKSIMAAATALTIGLAGLTAPALADHNDNYRRGYENRDDDRGYDYDRRYDRRYDHRRFDFDRHEGTSRYWERSWGWRHHDDDRYGHGRYGRTLPYWMLIRRIERQGYFGVRGLRPSRWGYGWRAFAFYRSDGHPAILRVDPATGRVLSVRHL